MKKYIGLFLGLAVLGLVGAGCTPTTSVSDKAEGNNMATEDEGNTMMVEDDKMMVTESMAKNTSMMEEDSGDNILVDNEPDEDSMVMEKKPTEDVMAKPSYTGQILAGSQSSFIEFNQTDYEMALAAHEPILLYFYANWCPICKEELVNTYEAFDEFNLPGVVGFRVNFNDNQTDNLEKSLASQFGVAYQHTKVLLNRQGERILKDPSSWQTDRYLEELSKLIK